MEDYDFSIRNEIDSLGHVDHELGGLLSRYNIPQGSSPPPPRAVGTPSSGDPYLANLVGQLQGVLGSVRQQPARQLGGSGFNLNIESDTLKWMLVLLFLLVVLWLVFSYTNKPTPARNLSRNPLKRRLRRLEAQVKRMHGQKIKQLPSDSIDDDNDDDVDEED